MKFVFNLFKKTEGRPPGEPFVWLTGMGLSVGLLMIVLLLGLIFWNGIQVFWAKEVVAIYGKHADGTNFVLGGNIVERRQKQNAPEGVMEMKLFLGNKDVYGEFYTHVDMDAIERIESPQDILIAERMENGDAIFYPETLVLKDGRILKSDDQNFMPTLKIAVEQARDRRETIEAIEHEKINRINIRLRKNYIQQRALIRKRGEIAESSPEMKNLKAKESNLQSQYNVLADEVKMLRERQQQDILSYRLISGEEKSIPVGRILAIYYPNQMSLLSKISYFIRHFIAFCCDNPRDANMQGGIFPAIFGTLVMTVLMSAAVMPFGVLAAIYLREYAKQNWFTQAVRISVNNLAGVPSIVFGIFGLGFFVYFLGGSLDKLFFADKLPAPTFGTGGVLWAALTLALMTVPVVIVSTEEALAAVPRGMREASLACGASKWQTIQHVVLPGALPGILTGLILAMARGAGEVAPLMLVGAVKFAPHLVVDSVAPFIHLERKFMHLGFHIYDLGFQSPDVEFAQSMVFATTFLLIVLIVFLNLGAILMRNRIRKKYSNVVF